MLEDKGFQTKFAYGMTRDGEEVKLEREMLRPIIRGRTRPALPEPPAKTS